jgi:glycosyltransferase involved in cell wall biosynthesis
MRGGGNRRAFTHGARSLPVIECDRDEARDAGSQLVTVVIPAFNAAATIEETLASVRAQTYPHLEILVIDDGSLDDTATIIEARGACDARIRLIRQSNGGVAEARNRGLKEARGEFIAFIDADDLWRPDKIARQIALLARGGDQMGFVYTWYALVDARGDILSLHHKPWAAGDIFMEMCRSNIVGNGSSVLFRTAALASVGGFDGSLRSRGAQGCEDLKTYLLVAERFRVGLIPDHLTGYRLLPDNMSSDVLQMLRSFDLVATEFAIRSPALAKPLGDGRMKLMRWLFARSLFAFRFADAQRLALTMVRQNIGLTIWVLLKGCLSRTRGVQLLPVLTRLKRKRSRGSTKFLKSWREYSIAPGPSDASPI